MTLPTRLPDHTIERRDMDGDSIEVELHDPASRLYLMRVHNVEHAVDAVRAAETQAESLHGLDLGASEWRPI